MLTGAARLSAHEASLASSQTGGLTVGTSAQRRDIGAHGQPGSKSEHSVLVCSYTRTLLSLKVNFLRSDATIQERFARKNEAAELHRAFNTLDRNHDGVIDADELNALFLDMGHKAKKV